MIELLTSSNFINYSTLNYSEHNWENSCSVPLRNQQTHASDNHNYIKKDPIFPSSICTSIVGEKQESLKKIEQ